MALLVPTIEEKPDGAPEWMVSFADMITIMMSFFVIMFALASGEKGKKDERQQAVLDSLEYRFGPKWHPLASIGLMPGEAIVPGEGNTMKLRTPPVDEDPDGEMVRIRGKKKARIFVPKSGDHAAVGGVIYFDQAGLELSDEQNERLRKLAEELAGKPQVIEILGHVSNRPMAADSTFRDGWDLAYARCRRVADLLATMRIEPQRLRVAVSRGGAMPGLTETPDDSRLDVRIDIYLTENLADGYSKAAESSEGNDQ
jgi:chemotaxis protein MotB